MGKMRFVSLISENKRSDQTEGLSSELKAGRTIGPVTVADEHLFIKKSIVNFSLSDAITSFNSQKSASESASILISDAFLHKNRLFSGHFCANPLNDWLEATFLKIFLCILHILNPFFCQLCILKSCFPEAKL